MFIRTRLRSIVLWNSDSMYKNLSRYCEYLLDNQRSSCRSCMLGKEASLRAVWHMRCESWDSVALSCHASTSSWGKVEAELYHQLDWIRNGMCLGGAIGNVSRSSVSMICKHFWVFRFLCDHVVFWESDLAIGEVADKFLNGWFAPMSIISCAAKVHWRPTDKIWGAIS